MYGGLTNDTSEPVFYIFAFSTSENLRTVILTAVLMIYLIILSGNLLIITLICLDPRLHTSMYFFLCNLSTLDILYVSTTIPKLIYVCHTGDHVISHTACMTQLYFYLICANTEVFLLTAMAIDRCVAVCFPLHYSLIMSKRVCVLLVFPAWFASFVNASIITYFANKLTFFASIEIKIFFCDVKPLMLASFSDITSLQTMIFVGLMAIGVIPGSLILASYTCIIYTILKIKSLTGRWKMFSNCSSHIMIVTVYFSSGILFYFSYSLEQDVVFSLLFVTLVPMLNLLVYSLRNKDIIQALRKIIHKKRTCLL